MARYFFELHECGEIYNDEDGMEAATIKDARELAISAARDVMCGEVKDGHLCLACHIEVLDEARTPVLKVAFREAITIAGL